MRFALAVLVIIAMTLPAAALAHDLGARAPAKPPTNHQPPPPDDSAIRQGGDTMLDAILIPHTPYDITGTTVGYTDDYDEACPYEDSTSPDVVYKFTPGWSNAFDFDLWGSSYDTKIYIYRENMTLVACNDDYYIDYVSKIEAVWLEEGVKYFVIIDGYGGDAGDYRLQIWDYCPCVVECPSGAMLEGEPPLEDGYLDEYNGGCNADLPYPPLQAIIGQDFCGVSGWYLYGGSSFRDTDWFEVALPWSGELIITADAEVATHVYELWPQDCDIVAVQQSITVGPCSEASMWVSGPVGESVWIWVGPTTFTPPGDFTDNEYDYVLTFEYEWEPTVAVEARTWTTVKSLFR